MSAGWRIHEHGIGISSHETQYAFFRLGMRMDRPVAEKIDFFGHFEVGLTTGSDGDGFLSFGAMLGARAGIRLRLLGPVGISIEGGMLENQYRDLSDAEGFSLEFMSNLMIGS